VNIRRIGGLTVGLVTALCAIWLTRAIARPSADTALRPDAPTDDGLAIPWAESGLVGIELVEELDLDYVYDGEGPIKGGPDAGCSLASEVFDAPGVYCLDSVLPSKDGPFYELLSWDLWQRMTGKTPSDEDRVGHASAMAGIDP
jgi:hypothetical protein